MDILFRIFSIMAYSRQEIISKFVFDYKWLMIGKGYLLCR